MYEIVVYILNHLKLRATMLRVINLNKSQHILNQLFQSDLFERKPLSLQLMSTLRVRAQQQLCVSDDHLKLEKIK